MCRPRQEGELRRALKSAAEHAHTFAGGRDVVHVADIAAELNVKPDGLRERLSRAESVERVKGYDAHRGRPCPGWALVDDGHKERREVEA